MGVCLKTAWKHHIVTYSEGGGVQNLNTLLLSLVTSIVNPISRKKWEL